VRTVWALSLSKGRTADQRLRSDGTKQRRVLGQGPHHGFIELTVVSRQNSERFLDLGSKVFLFGEGQISQEHRGGARRFAQRQQAHGGTGQFARRLLLDAPNQVTSAEHGLRIAVLDRFAQLRQGNAAKLKQLLRGGLAGGVFVIAELADPFFDGAAKLRRQDVLTDDGEQRAPIGVAPPRHPSIAVDSARDLVFAPQPSHRRPLTGQPGQKHLDGTALLGRQLREQIDKDGNSFGIVRLRQGQRRLFAHAGRGILELFA
jgi:hypothetical protein